MKRKFFAFFLFLNSLISFGNASLDDQENDPAHIKNLNFDCEEKILNYLEGGELIKLRLVSQFWNKRVMQHPGVLELIEKAKIRSILQKFYLPDSKKQLMIVCQKDLDTLDSIKTEISTLCSGNHFDVRPVNFYGQAETLTILEKIIYKNKNYQETQEETLYAMTQKHDYATPKEINASAVPGHSRPSVLWLRKKLPKGEFFISTKENIPLLQKHLKEASKSLSVF